jgi:two-component system chemotaxis response regulator CheY|tara:strand:- start:1313 stop:1726 length:414 start_codon:yes stop_codon:yes gene_type:complete
MGVMEMFSKETKFLIVDDMLTARKFITKNLRELGYTEFIEARNGEVAWQILSKEDTEIDFIISDYDMPVMSGFELLKKVRASEKLKETIFLMITAVGQENKMMEVLDAGVNNYLIKPFDKEVLAEKLESTWESINNR